jgi:hypothetical protein
VTCSSAKARGPARRRAALPQSRARLLGPAAQSQRLSLAARPGELRCSIVRNLNPDWYYGIWLLRPGSPTLGEKLEKLALASPAAAQLSRGAVPY